MATSAQLRREILAGQWDEALCTLYGTEPAMLGPPAATVCRRAGTVLSCTMAPGGRCMSTSAPGRAELGGNHTDHQHGYGLAGSGDAGSGRSGIPQ